MTEVHLRLPAYNWTSYVQNSSLNHVINDRGHGYGQNNVGYGNVHDLHSHNGLDRGASSPRARSEDDWGSCRDWQDAQHTLFQLANVCAAISILTPTSFKHHLLFLRCLLLVAFLFFVLWAGLFVCMLDVLVWNCVFFVVDLVHIVSLAYNSIPVRVSPSLCDLYVKRFKPLRVNRKEYAYLCSRGHMVTLRKGTRYALEDVTPCREKVSMLIRGRLKVSHNNVYLHCIQPNEFVDSIEFDSALYHLDTAEKFQVTVVATEDSLVLSWLHPTLRDHMAEHQPFMWAVLKGLVGKDVSDKLYKIQELLLKEPEVMLGSAPSTPRPPALMHKARRPGGVTTPNTPSPALLATPRYGILGVHSNIVPRRLSSQPNFTHMTEVPPPQTALKRGESFV